METLAIMYLWFASLCNDYHLHCIAHINDNNISLIACANGFAPAKQYDKIIMNNNEFNVILTINYECHET